MVFVFLSLSHRYCANLICRSNMALRFAATYQAFPWGRKVSAQEVGGTRENGDPAASWGFENGSRGGRDVFPRILAI